MSGHTPPRRTRSSADALIRWLTDGCVIARLRAVGTKGLVPREGPGRTRQLTRFTTKLAGDCSPAAQRPGPAPQQASPRGVAANQILPRCMIAQAPSRPCSRRRPAPADDDLSPADELGRSRPKPLRHDMRQHVAHVPEDRYRHFGTFGSGHPPPAPGPQWFTVDLARSTSRGSWSATHPACEPPTSRGARRAPRSRAARQPLCAPDSPDRPASPPRARP